MGPSEWQITLGERSGAKDAPLSPGDVVGRYRIEGVLGEGGMGVVYVAHDPELDRRIALKRLRLTQGVTSEARLVREAQVMARLRHPNVVGVHDVGIAGGRVFVAMELVEGITLHDWRLSSKHSWREIVRMFLGAGRGLAAAHASGVVHRDFKPENVLVGADGAPRVADFGIAWASGEAASTEGQIVGTPAYMSPEQHSGEPVGPSSDQFAFSVALWESLAGARPFASTSGEQLFEDKRAGRVVAPLRRVPGWLSRALLIGLAADPRRRHASMEAFLDVLERGLLRRRRAAIAGFGLVTAGTLIVSLGGLFGASARLICSRAGSPAHEVWNAASKEKVERAFLATGRNHAAETVRRVEAELDRRIAGWSRMSEESCRASRIDGVESGPLFERRAVCLERRRGELSALVEVFGHADPETVDGAVDALAKLPALASCADAEELLSAYPPPAPPLVEAVAEARQLVARVTALIAAGSYGEALTSSRPAVQKGRELGYPPLLAEALFVHARALSHAGEAEPAVIAHKEAALAAAHARDDRSMALALIDRVETTGRDAGKAAEALAQVELAALAVARAGNPAELSEELHLVESGALQDLARHAEALVLLEEVKNAREKRLGLEHNDTGRIYFRLAAVLQEVGRDDEALGYYHRGLTIAERKLGSGHPNIGMFLNNIGLSEEHAGRFEDARRSFSRSLEIKELTLGPEHPSTANTLNNLAMVANDQGRFDEEAKLQERVLAIREKVLGPEHAMTASTLSGLASCRRRSGRLDEALALSQRALAIREKLLGPDHPNVAATLTVMSATLVDLGRFDEAILAARRATAIREKALGPGHDTVAQSLDALATALLAAGQSGEACAAFKRAVKILEDLRGPEHPDLAGYLAGRAHCLLAEAQVLEAIAAAERGVSVGERGGRDPKIVARARFVLARALWAQRSHERALAEARLAAPALAGSSEGQAIEKWLRQRPAPQTHHLPPDARAVDRPATAR